MAKVQDIQDVIDQHQAELIENITKYNKNRKKACLDEIQELSSAKFTNLLITLPLSNYLTNLMAFYADNKLKPDFKADLLEFCTEIKRSLEHNPLEFDVLAYLLYAFARHGMKEFAEIIADHQQQLLGIKISSLSLTLYSYLYIEKAIPDRYLMMLNKYYYKDFTISEQRQISTIYAQLSDDQKALCPLIKQKILLWEENLKNEVCHRSNFELEIVRLLKTQFGNGSVEIDHWIGQVATKVDIFLPKTNTVIQVDGPPHYYVNHPQQENEKTKLNTRLLEKAGFKVVRFPYFGIDLSLSDVAKTNLLCEWLGQNEVRENPQREKSRMNKLAIEESELKVNTFSSQSSSAAVSHSEKTQLRKNTYAVLARTEKASKPAVLNELPEQQNNLSYVDKNNLREKPISKIPYVVLTPVVLARTKNASTPTVVNELPEQQEDIPFVDRNNLRKKSICQKFCVIL